MIVGRVRLLTELQRMDRRCARDVNEEGVMDGEDEGGIEERGLNCIEAGIESADRANQDERSKRSLKEISGSSNYSKYR